MKDEAQLKDKTEGPVTGVGTRLEHKGYSGDFEYDGWAEEFFGAKSSDNAAPVHPSRLRRIPTQCH
jgi:hypothetical protein